MVDKDYNLYIENYLKNDITKSAIMLTAPWGMGKSYYIQNSLIPYLQKDEKKTCVVVSLYGLNDVKEISRAIYLEMRAKSICEKREGVEAGKIIGKTILKGVLSKVGVDLSINEEDLEKLYNSIDLSNKLLIFEDLERSGISIKQVLGYVNNLVEQDGAKVLLIANENEIKKTKKVSSKDKNGDLIYEWVYDDETEEYFKIKEKTVSDTILYLCDYRITIENILKMFSNKNIDLCLEEKDKNGNIVIVNEILSVMNSINVYNLRSLIFACQKTVDIFSNYKEALNSEFFKYVFMGNVAFALRMKSKDDIKWDENTNPNQLGTSKYPLHKFCYDFIKMQELDLIDIKDSQEDFISRKEFEKKQRETNTALNILYEFPTQKGIVLNCAIKALRDELKEGNNIPLLQYGKLANYLIAVKSIIKNPELIDECKSIMLQNVKNEIEKDDRILDRLRIHDRFTFWEDGQSEEYNRFLKDLKLMFEENSFKQLETDDPLIYLNSIAELMRNDDSAIRQVKGFLEKLDKSKILAGLEVATAEQVSEFRGGILYVYRISNIREFLPNDKDSLIELKEGVEELLENDKGFDKIVQLQYSWLIDNIDTVLDYY